MRRTPAATPPSDVTANRPMSPVARTWVPPHSSWLTSAHGDHAHRVAVLLAEERHRAGGDRLVRALHLGRHRDVGQDVLVDQVLDRRARSSADSAVKCAKSKRSRSGATSEPACLTCAPSVCRSAACSRWVAVWLRRVASRVSTSTVGLDGRAGGQHALGDLHLVQARPARHAHHARHARRAAAALQRALVGHLAAGLEVEGRLGQRRRSPPRRRSARTSPTGRCGTAR